MNLTDPINPPARRDRLLPFRVLAWVCWLALPALAIAVIWDPGLWLRALLTAGVALLTGMVALALANPSTPKLGPGPR